VLGNIFETCTDAIGSDSDHPGQKLARSIVSAGMRWYNVELTMAPFVSRADPLAATLFVAPSGTLIDSRPHDNCFRFGIIDQSLSVRVAGDTCATKERP
jgi:hypothetical protein